MAAPPSGTRASRRPPRRSNLGAVLLAALGASLGVSACTPETASDPGRIQVGDAIEVKFSGGSEMQSYDEVQTGRGASFPLPYVCALTDDPIRITGIDLQTPEPGLSVTGFLVADEPGAPGAIVSRPLDETPQGKHAAPDGLISAQCDSDESVQVWVEVTLERTGAAQAQAVRYRYSVDGEDEQATDWFPTGVGLSTATAR